MPRVAHNLTAALLCFAIGVVVATFSRSILPRFAHFIGPHSTTERAADHLKDGACNEWEKTGSVSDGLGWDLTYMSLLRNSGVCPGQVYCDFAAEKPQPPVNKHFAEWQGDPIISSILIELPDGHADMMAWWLIRTKEQAYWWTFHPHHSNPMGVQSLPTEVYDRAFETITCWQPHDPSNLRFFDGRGDGYIGFLSLYKEGKSRQMLLTSKDMFEVWPKGSEMPDEAGWGRLWKTLMPIYSVIREQQKQPAQVSK